MNTNDFNKPITAAKLNENMFKKFGSKINFSKYSREELENYRNLLRTQVNQRESAANFNDLLTNETYQRDKYMLSVLNTRIKEMLGESIHIMEKKLTAAEKKKKEKVAKAIEKKQPGMNMGKKMAIATATAKKTAKKAEAVDEASEVDKSKIPAFLRKGKEGKAGLLTLKDIEKEKDKSPTTAKGLAKKKAEVGITDEKVDEAKKKPSAGMTAKQKSATVKQAKAGKDIGKPGKEFDVIADKAATKYKSKASGKKVAAAAMWKNKAKKLKESVEYLMEENKEEQAQIISSGIDMVQDFTSWMQRIGSYQTKSMLEMGDDIRGEFGLEKAEEFKGAVAPALSDALQTLTDVRERLTNAVAVLAGQEPAPSETMGAEGEMPGEEVSSPDTMNMSPADEFAASDAAAGGSETAGRARRESREYAKAKQLDEAHSIMSRLAK